MPKVVIGGLALLAGVGFGYLVWGGAGDRGARPRETSGRGDSMAAEVARLEARLKAQETLNAELKAQLSARPADEPARAAAAVEGGATAERGEGAPRRHEPRFQDRAIEAALRSGDWGAAGAATAKLMPLLSEATDVVYGRRPMRAELWSDIYQGMGPVVTLAVKMETQGVPWSHPFVQANLLHATLREAGRPMDEGQEEALERIGSRHVEEDGRRRASHDKQTPALRRLLEQHGLLDRFFAEVEPGLRDDQRAVLWPPGVRGVVGLDIFSGGTVWHDKLEHLKHKDHADLKAQMSAILAQELKLRAEVEPSLRQIVEEWEASLPEAFVLAEPDAGRASDPDMEPSARVLFAAQRQLALFEALLARAPLDDAERRRVLDAEDVHLPLLVR